MQTSNQNVGQKLSTMPLLKGNLGPRQMYIGHFQGSQTPDFRKSRMLALREESLKTQLERIENNPDLKKTVKEEMIKQLKFSENEKRLDSRDFWFQFTEMDNDDEVKKDIKEKDNKDRDKDKDKDKDNNNNTSTTNNGTNDNNTTANNKRAKSKGGNANRIFLGKPTVGRDTHNYVYCVIEVQEDYDEATQSNSRTAHVYPADMIEFGLESLMVSSEDMTSEKLEKEYRRRMRKFQTNLQTGEFKTLSRLFGHDKLADDDVTTSKRVASNNANSEGPLTDLEQIVIKELEVGSISTSNITGIFFLEKKNDPLKKKKMIIQKKKKKKGLTNRKTIT
ncbi:hypothetical protein RFI_06917 [Reticulomyxa filosa]|uniref:Uncharacterized protein n=1 Tax=Reticulomyxa filosa TaxID=46433 RepID=X6NWE4_RETFI|nr:hypothetical protein RFI_06917 [Reticulomyxa filosa]|eukprot:ETO30203.1 hypothetical protein RFI_06917 [Reticulomyxa filosa]